MGKGEGEGGKFGGGRKSIDEFCDVSLQLKIFFSQLHEKFQLSFPIANSYALVSSRASRN